MRGSDREQLKRTMGERVMYALLRPAARVALALGLSKRQLRDRLQMAQFHEARDRGLKLRQICDLLDVSPRTAAQLSKQLKENFLDVESEVALPRRIEFLLWAEPLSTARIRQVLTEADNDAIDDALTRLEEEGRITREADAKGRWNVVRGDFRLVDAKGWLSRLDGLDTLLGTVADAAWSRFFGDPQQQKRSFARNLALRVRRDDIGRLAELYQQTIWPFLAALDEAARGDPEAIPIDLAILWAPLDSLLAEGLPEAAPRDEASEEEDR